MKNVGFMRYLRQEWNKEKRATFGSTFIPFQLVEVSLLWLLFSRASVRFSQQRKYNKLTQFIEQTPSPLDYARNDTLRVTATR